MTDDHDGDEILKGPASLSTDGRLEQRFGHMEPPGGPPRAEEQLELAEVAPPVIEPRIEKFRDDPPRRARSWAAWLVVVALLGGLAAMAVLIVLKPRFERPLRDGVREADLLDQLGTERPPLIISSEPPGALITIGGKKVGETPWAGENLWTVDTPVVLQLTGFRRWEGQIKGGQAATLDIRLKK